MAGCLSEEKNTLANRDTYNSIFLVFNASYHMRGIEMIGKLTVIRRFPGFKRKGDKK